MPKSDDLERHRSETRLSNGSTDSKTLRKSHTSSSSSSTRRSDRLELTFDMESEVVNESKRECIFDESGKRRPQFQPPIDVPIFSREIVIRFQNSPDQIRNTKTARLNYKHMVNRLKGQNKKLYPKKPGLGA